MCKSEREGESSLSANLLRVSSVQLWHLTEWDSWISFVAHLLPINSWAIFKFRSVLCQFVAFPFYVHDRHSLPPLLSPHTPRPQRLVPPLRLLGWSLKANGFRKEQQQKQRQQVCTEVQWVKVTFKHIFHINASNKGKYKWRNNIKLLNVIYFIIL